MHPDTPQPNAIDDDTPPQSDEMDEVLDSPPDLPLSEPTPPENLLLPEFEKWLAQGERLCAKSFGLFADTAHAQSNLENFAEKLSRWLRTVAKAKQAAVQPNSDP